MHKLCICPAKGVLSLDELFSLFSMEECDALCTRLVIMVNGQFVCPGSPQHLKDKFGNGYTLTVRLSAENGDSAIVKNFITEKFPDSQVFDDHQDYLHFRIPNTSVSLSSVFGAMEKASETLGIEDYSVHQTTLEQLFLSFTNKQVPPEEKKKGKRLLWTVHILLVLCRCVLLSWGLKSVCV